MSRWVGVTSREVTVVALLLVLLGALTSCAEDPGEREPPGPATTTRGSEGTEEAAVTIPYQPNGKPAEVATRSGWGTGDMWTWIDDVEPWDTKTLYSKPPGSDVWAEADEPPWFRADVTSRIAANGSHAGTHGSYEILSGTTAMANTIYRVSFPSVWHQPAKYKIDGAWWMELLDIYVEGTADVRKSLRPTRLGAPAPYQASEQTRSLCFAGEEIDVQEGVSTTFFPPMNTGFTRADVMKGDWVDYVHLDGRFSVWLTFRDAPHVQTVCPPLPTANVQLLPDKARPRTLVAFDYNLGCYYSFKASMMYLGTAMYTPENLNSPYFVEVVKEPSGMTPGLVKMYQRYACGTIVNDDEPDGKQTINLLPATPSGLPEPHVFDVHDRADGTLVALRAHTDFSALEAWKEEPSQLSGKVWIKFHQPPEGENQPILIRGFGSEDQHEWMKDIAEGLFDKAIKYAVVAGAAVLTAATGGAAAPVAVQVIIASAAAITTDFLHNWMVDELEKRWPKRGIELHRELTVQRGPQVVYDTKCGKVIMDCRCAQPNFTSRDAGKEVAFPPPGGN
jgi:hypothetical protein